MVILKCLMLSKIIIISQTSDDNFKDPNWLENGIKFDSLYLYTKTDKDSNGVKEWENVSWETGDNNIQEIDDEKDTARAEANYNRTMADIQSKDKRFDLQLKQIDTEHQATKQLLIQLKKQLKKILTET